MSNVYFMYKNTEPAHRAQLSQKELDLLLQTLHIHNSRWNSEAEGPELSSTWFSLLGKVMEWES